MKNDRAADMLSAVRERSDYQLNMKDYWRVAAITVAAFCLALAGAGTGKAQNSGGIGGPGVGISGDISGDKTLITTAKQNPVTPLGRVDLFNGKDFVGWEFFMKSNAVPAETWRIEDGIIKCIGKPNGFMRTKQDYRDYKVTVEWRFTKPGNTGVLVHMQQPDAVWPRCVECQGMHNQQGDFWLWGGADFKEPKNFKKNGIERHEKEAEKAVGE